MTPEQRQLITDAFTLNLREYIDWASKLPDNETRAVALMQPLHFMTRGMRRWHSDNTLQQQRITAAYSKLCDASRELNDIFECNPRRRYSQKIDRGAMHMTMKEFVDGCQNGPGFIDYDGYGHYATADAMSDEVIVPSDVTSGKYDAECTHVVWFNR